MLTRLAFCFWTLLTGCLVSVPPVHGLAGFSPRRLAAAAAVGAGTAAATVAGGTALALWTQQRQKRQSTNPNGLYTPARGSLQGQVFFITGSTSGLGLETAQRLAMGSPDHIILTARSDAKGQAAVASVQAYVAEQMEDSTAVKVSYKLLDLSSLEGIRQAVAQWTNDDDDDDDLPAITCLVNNAGIMALPRRQVTMDGYERQMATNHLGHFCLTACLAPKITRDARIVNVASSAHQMAVPSGMDFDYCWTGEPGYGAWRSYAQSKLANMLYSQELQRRADAAGLAWQVSCLHPGVVQTDLGRYMMGSSSSDGDDETRGLSQPPSVPGLVADLANWAAGLFLKTPAQGATTQIYLAAGASSAPPRAQYYVDCEPRPVTAYARDRSAARQLWEESEERAGVTIDWASVGSQGVATSEQSVGVSA
jgi:NAD(P)-dependent dehydrogenase (short-subunit alcohol dehydrogenase family)